ncbi:DUF1631 family protein [Aquabacterium sp.]|uniref:DUF1631 family protein n=1 Tax=Aquabacterium sp. TaxID=1872578 RepID=UPI0035B1F327
MIDPRLDPILQACLSRIQVGMVEAVDKASAQLGLLASSTTSNAQRQLLMNAQFDLQRRTNALNQAFAKELQQRTDKDARRKASGGAAYAETDWDSLSLVDNAQVERNVIAERLAQSLAHECDADFKALHDHLSTLLDDTLVEHNPLRPQVVTYALLEALSHVSQDDEVIKTLAQHITRLFAPTLAGCYQHAVGQLKAQGVVPAAPAMHRQRGSSGASSTSPGQIHSGPRSQSGPLTSPGQLGTASGHGGSQGGGHSAPVPLDTQRRAAKALSEMFGVAMPGGELGAGGSSQSGWGAGPSGWGAAAAQAAPLSGNAMAAANLTALIRQLNHTPAGDGQETQPTPMGAGWGGTSPGTLVGPGGSELFGLQMMAPNLIRAHRDELVQASGGAALSQMVIDIVAALFDQVLSDPKVPPQMARQIARLQLPVLRVAMQDMSFFNSRKHPVRRFVNRIATLSAAFDDSLEGMGPACLARVKSLIDDVVDGEFDRMDLYEAKLAELEAFIDEQNKQESAESAAVAALLSGKEADLRVQQRYMQLLKRELADIDMPEFVREFLTQIWSQVQVMAATRDGMDSPLSTRIKKAGRELAVSIQPKGSPQLRRDFLIKLPQLMKDLNEGLSMIQWPEEARQDFFSKLLPAHAEALKAQPPHDLTTRLMEQQLNKVDRLAIPSRDEAANDPLPVMADNLEEASTLTVVTALSAEEVQSAGFIPEAALPSADDPLDIDLTIGAAPEDPTLSELDINLDTPPPPTAGMQLVHHINKGTAYQMLMQGQWKRVRLTWVSEGRTFFIFTHGHQHKQTISLTGRTLAKMCDSGRFKAFEQAELLERATARARRQLAELSSGKTAA